MHNRIWSEAARLRTNGGILASFKKIRSKIYVIQGVCDPHPIKGVTAPLQENNVPFEAYALEKCGHSLFMENYARDEFYDILIRILS